MSDVAHEERMRAALYGDGCPACVAPTAERDELATLSLKATKALGYLNGMVSRGIGSDINSEDITANVAGYVMELERERDELRARVEELERTAEWVSLQRNWREDFYHENGNYQNTCNTCGSLFTGHKRRVECRLCAVAPPHRQGE